MNASPLALAALGLTLAAAPSAMAQAVIQACAVNDAGGTIQSRFVYHDWQGRQHSSAWVARGRGGANCVTLQDLQTLRIEIEELRLRVMVPLCTRTAADPKRNFTVAVRQAVGTQAQEQRWTCVTIP